MPLFALATLIYLVIGSLVVLAFRDNPISLIIEMLETIPHGLSSFLNMGWWLLPFFAGFVVLTERETLVMRLAHTILAAFACTAFMLVFTILKTTMPLILPFWADPPMAMIDRVLHFGVDPWVWTHAVSDWVSPVWAANIYFNYWLLPAIYLPVLISMFDRDQMRIRRFLILHVFTWIGLGNIVALGFLSAGPVYYDRLYGGDMFAPMLTALEQSGVLHVGIGQMMDRLWDAYASGAQEVGSGISAFPSVHVGMATVFALYLYERHRLFLLPSVALVATYQFLSVYQGWHYAIDGYFSILAVVGVWAALRRHARKKRLSTPLADPI